jgi:hypothetical protein
MIQVELEFSPQGSIREEHTTGRLYFAGYLQASPRRIDSPPRFVGPPPSACL